ncbi:MAG: sulfatase-like hydrolase/transferase [bacterium]|nr:sulfatase-like hydrolase/transferase [bacterium]
MTAMPSQLLETLDSAIMLVTQSKRFTLRFPIRLRLISFILCCSFLAAPFAATKTQPTPKEKSQRPDVILITLDTTRADALGIYGAKNATPNLDNLARSGIRYDRAITPSPLTLPAHASLLTGLTPPEHGIHDNGIAALHARTPTLAAILTDQGYATAAFVGSRVLDRRFGLNSGFTDYDDVMAAEYVGEYGYPERNAEAVTDSVLAWSTRHFGNNTSKHYESPDPMFLWIHYYDPHLPYEAPGDHSRDPKDRYQAEVSYVDRQIGRLLSGLPNRPRIVVVVGDHGEALGAHGESAHGLLLHEPTLRVPMILHGVGIPEGKVVKSTVAIRRLAATILELLGVADDLPGIPLPIPGLETAGESRLTSRPFVYSETHLPYTAYGWSVLESITDGQWRYIQGAKSELFDLDSDPEENHNLVESRKEEAQRLHNQLESLRDSHKAQYGPTALDDPKLNAALRSLGYLSGASGRDPGRPDAKRLDPKEGLALLDDLESAKALTAQGNPTEALIMLEAMAERNPDNVPLLNQLARNQIAVALSRRESPEPGLETYRQAIALNPKLEFLHLGLARALQQLGRIEPAKDAYRAALELDPRNAEASLALAEIANRGGKKQQEREILERATVAGTESAAILARLAQIELSDSTPESTARAGERLRHATKLTPDWTLLWLLLGRWELDHGSPTAAHHALQQVIQRAPNSREATQARAWLTEK